MYLYITFVLDVIAMIPGLKFLSIQSYKSLSEFPLNQTTWFIYMGFISYKTFWSLHALNDQFDWSSLLKYKKYPKKHILPWNSVEESLKIIWDCTFFVPHLLNKVSASHVFPIIITCMGQKQEGTEQCCILLIDCMFCSLLET